ncbi:hypothetical protein N7509_003916 [Penicillium cosmopolitanum]|uniref:Uncharacterized protein n=1 Tax=Penicillium cosmopolitanum TaxID=1131564 RepID=A0A9W9W5Y9_9EURO|nr:uncharacterized protein N7509_003916 [Penicillium cosmopolitanum]KAJ5404045.1 hypothetical protein N7509_003916 [Penicillium cosmopolitanum]
MDPFDLRPFFKQSLSVVFSLDETNRNVFSYQNSITQALKTKYGIEAYTGASPAQVYMTMFAMSSVLFHAHPDRRWLYNAMWARVFDSEYLSTEEGAYNWLAIAIKQRAWIGYDGMRILPVLGTEGGTLALFNSLVQLDTNEWEAEFCFDTFETPKITGSIYYIASVFQSCCHVPDMSPKLDISMSYEQCRAEVDQISHNIALYYSEKFLSSASLPDAYEKNSKIRHGAGKETAKEGFMLKPEH